MAAFVREPGARSNGDARARAVTTKGAETNRRLVAAARRIFEDVGYVDARIADITEAAGSSNGTFYTYFDSKDEILMAVAIEVFEELESATRLESRVDNAIEAIAVVNEQYLDTWMRNRKILNTINQASGFLPAIFEKLGENHRRHVARYAATLKRMQDAGEVDGDLDPYHAAAALGSMVEQSVRWWVGHDEPYERELALQTLAKLWVRAIGLDRNGRRGARADDLSPEIGKD
ncbi:MAG: TetR/AcrR family transcriptional regulator [Actinomycetota bacterium]